MVLLILKVLTNLFVHRVVGFLGSFSEFEDRQFKVKVFAVVIVPLVTALLIEHEVHDLLTFY